jgi:lysyl-tRNA synthetase class 2
VHIEPLPSSDRYLITSPEFHMKRLVAAGYGRIHQICRCFRRGEQGGLHNPEFTMLEWYRPGASYLELAAELEAMVATVARATIGTTALPGRAVDLAAPWERLTVRDAFARLAGWDPVEDPDEERFFLDLVDRVEPHLGRSRPTILYEYPAPLAALARLSPANPSVAERFELYVDGVELVNAYEELLDPVEQRARFEADNRRRASEGKAQHPVDERLIAALGSMPRTAGAALGVDRLVMLLLGAARIDEVIAFPEPWL